MSETLCTLRIKGGGGGRYTETSLWTNPSPSSGFATQDVTLSQSMDNFKYLAFKVSNGSANFKAIVSVAEFKTMPLSGANAFAIFPGNANSAGNTYFARFVTYKNTTTVNITTGYQLGGTSQNNTYSIPLEILGLNELDHGTMITTNADILPFKALPANTAISFTTKAEAKAIWIICKAQSSGTDCLVLTNVNPTTNEIDNNTIYRARTSSLGTFDINTGRSFTVTENTISSSSLSSNAYYISCAYTY